MKDIKVAAIQMTSSADLDANLETATELIDHAVSLGAMLVVLPEFFVCISSDGRKVMSMAEKFGQGKVQSHLSALAVKNGIHLVGGSIPLRSEHKDKVYNTSLLFGPSGDCISRYDKIHLFQYKGRAEAYDESKTMAAGNEPVTYDAPFGRLGMTVCYDLRFPELYRSLGEPDILTVPSAFTVPTGKAHWELLIRTRALENQCYLVAACQCGAHDGGRKTWGHSVIVNPWGDILSGLKKEEGVCCATLESEVLEQCRERLPALRNKKL